MAQVQTIGPPSIRERITGALLARLIANLSPIAVLRAPVPPANRSALPLLVIEPQGESVEQREGEMVERHLTFVLAVLTRGDNAAAQADALQVAAHQALMATAQAPEPNFLIREIDCDWDVEDADLIALRLTTRYQITYHSHPHDISRED